MVEGTGDADEPANVSVLIVEWFFGGIGPVDKAVAARDEFNAVHDGFAGFKNAEVIHADVLHDVLRNVVVVSFS